MVSRYRRLGVVLAAVVLMAAACRSPARPQVSPSPSPIPSATVSPSASPSPSPLGRLECNRSSGDLIGGGRLVLDGVTAAAHPGYDRITFSFRALPAPSGVMANYTVSAASPPFAQDGSGKPLTVEGTAFLKVVFHDAFGANPDSPSAGPTAPRDLKPHLGTLTEAQESGDFEGYLTWILGISRSACWRITQLANPPRFVLDVPNG